MSIASHLSYGENLAFVACGVNDIIALFLAEMWKIRCLTMKKFGIVVFRSGPPFLRLRSVELSRDHETATAIPITIPPFPKEIVGAPKPARENGGVGGRVDH